MKKRILVISTYPIRNSQHGGQKRVSAFVNEYRKAGHEVKHLGIFLDTTYAAGSDIDIAVSHKLYNNEPLMAVIGDLLLSTVLSDSEEARLKFKDIVISFAPDVVQIEQTFLYETVKRALHEMDMYPTMVNSTHNIESILKVHILKSITNLTSSEIDSISKKIYRLEEFAARDASWTIACTESDADVLKKMGARDVIVSPNGISRELVDEKELAKQRQRFATNGIKRIIVYIGSAHPPNLTGFRELVGGSVGALNDDEKLLVVGGVADLIYGYSQELPNYIRPIFMDKVILLGMVEEKTLSALLSLADEIILPILEGGGSNLKTAEAILADKQVVATTKSLHSYERYLKLPNLAVADTKKEFVQAMVKGVRTQKKQRSAEERRLAEGVLWQNTLSKSVERLGE